jgi:pimeloyl-ACP methyl ester carboxylesterase
MKALNVLRRTRIVPVALMLCIGLGPVTSSDPVSASPSAPAQSAIDPFYTPPSPLPNGSPGDLIRSERTTVSPLAGIPLPGVNAWRLMYRSTSATDQQVAVTGTLMVPQVPWLLGRRPVVSYALGTHGMGEQCTPSIQFRSGTQFELGVIGAYLAQGWAVVVTDYQRRPVHTYVNTRMAAHSVLDAARAAGRVPGSGITAANPVAVSGYSQGGHAAAAAAERQPTYAPDLNLKGVAAGGVPADLRAVANAVERDVLFGVVPMAVASLSAAYPELPLDGLNDTGRAAITQVTGQCIVETTTQWAFRSATELTVGGRTIDEFFASQPAWAARVDEQRIGRLRPGVPVLAYQGLLDPWVPHAVTQQLATDWCGLGANVRFRTYPIAEHFGGLGEAIPEVVLWLHSRFADMPSASTC